jgi:putative inorganic carbon (HCO3(-)) transporter
MPSLDGLRAVSIVLIVFGRFACTYGAPAFLEHLPLSSVGKVGVRKGNHKRSRSRRTDALIMAFFLYLAFIALSYLRPVEAFAPELEVYRPMLILGSVALAAAVVHAVTAGRVAARKLHFVLMLALLVCIALSKIANGWPGGAAVALSTFSPSALLFLLTVLNVTSISRLRVTLATIVLSTLVISVAGIAAYHSGFMADRLVLRQQIGAGDAGELADAMDVPASDTSGQFLWRVRNIGFLSDPNDFAQVIVVALPMLGIWHRPQRFFSNVVLLGVPGATFLYTIFLTHSRGAVLGLASLLFFGMQKTLGVVKAGILVGVLLAIAVMNVSGERGFSAQEESAGDRILAWSEGLTMLRHQPLFGVGYNNFTEHHHLTAHNSFVLCFAELGLIGYFAWLALVVTAFRDVNQVANLSVEGTEVVSRRYAAMLRSSLLGFLTCAFFLSRTYAPPLFLLLALCAVTWRCAGDAESNTKLLPARGWVLSTSSILVGSLVLVYLMVLAKHGTS